jgi:hypothetical protein
VLLVVVVILLDLLLREADVPAEGVAVRSAEAAVEVVVEVVVEAEEAAAVVEVERAPQSGCIPMPSSFAGIS